MSLLPNLFITGTPGVGKSSFAEALADALNEFFDLECDEHKYKYGDAESAHKFKVLEVGKLIKQESLYSDWDKARDCSIFDPDQLYDRLEEILTNDNTGGWIVEFHSSGSCERSWFNGFILLRASTENVFDRLTARKYASAKVQENVHCEIFGVVKDELIDMLAGGEGDLDAEDVGWPQGGQTKGLLASEAAELPEALRQSEFFGVDFDKGFFELPNNTFDDADLNVQIIQAWVKRKIVKSGA